MTPTNPSDLNLTMHRSEKSVWSRRGWDGTREALTPARVLIGVGGAALAVQALRHRTWSSRVLAGLGTSLAWWALTGEGDLSSVRRMATRVTDCFAKADPVAWRIPSPRAMPRRGRRSPGQGPGSARSGPTSTLPSPGTRMRL